MPKRKRTQVRESEIADDKSDQQDRDLSHSVLGGLKDHTLNSRVSGEETNEDEHVTHYKIPFNDKFIICERQGGSKSASLIFTHGAGGGIANPATRSFATGYAVVSPITCFQGTMNLTNRIKTFHATIAHEKADASIALGGRSMGARAAVVTALEMEVKPRALVLVSYPLMAGSKGGKREPERREKILTDLPKEMDVLFVVGSQDAQCDLQQLNGLREKMEARSWLLEVKGADHGMSIKAKNGVESVRQKSGGIAAEWLKGRDSQSKYCAIEWDADNGNISSDGWITNTSSRPETPKVKKQRSK